MTEQNMAYTPTIGENTTSTEVFPQQKESRGNPEVITISVTHKGASQDVELKLTRGGLRIAERNGTLDMNMAQSATMSYIYALGYAAVVTTMRNVKVYEVDDAIDQWLDLGNSFADLATNLSEQYASLLGIAGPTDSN